MTKPCFGLRVFAVSKNNYSLKCKKFIKFELIEWAIVMKKTIIIGAVVLLIMAIFSVIYVGRINLYNPIEITINFPNSDSGNITVRCVSVLGKVTETKAISSNRFVINEGYFNQLIITNTAKDFDTENLPVATIKMFNDNKWVIIKTINLSNTPVVLKNIGAKNYADIMLTIFRYNKTLILSFGILFFCFLIIGYTERHWKQESLFKLILNLVIIWGYGWLLFAGFFTYPNAEDLSLAFRPILKAVYGPVDLRYTTNFLYAISPFSLGGIGWYRVNSWLLLLSFTVALYYFIRTIFRYDFFNRPMTLKLAMLVAVIHFLSTPSISQDLYWMGSSFVYLASWSFILFWASFMYRYFVLNQSIIYFFLSCWFLFFCMGCVETNVVVCFVILSIFCFSPRKFGHKFNYRLLWLWLILFSGVIVIITDFGNQGRIAASNISLTGDYLWDQISLSSLGFVKNLIVVFVTTIPWLLWLYLSLRKYSFTDCEKPCYMKILGISLLLLGAMLANTVIFFLFLSVESFSPERVMNYIHVGVLLGIIGLGLWFMMRFNRFSNAVATGKMKMVVPFSLLIFLGYMFILPNNISLIVKESVDGTLLNYRRESIELFEILNKAHHNNDSIVIVRELKTIPKSVVSEPLLHVHYKDTTGNKWPTLFERYFNVPEVIVVSRSEPFLSD